MEVEGAFFNISDYEIQSPRIGQDAFGSVYIAENLTDKQKYAAKILNITDNFDGREQTLFLRESMILHRLFHPSIIKFIGINFKSFTGKPLLEPAIITEYIPNGSLGKLLSNKKNSSTNINFTSTKKSINLLGISDAMRCDICMNKELYNEI